MICIPHYDQWLGVWAIRPEEFHAGHQWYMKTDLHVHLASPQAQQAMQTGAAVSLDVRDGLAVIGLYGSLMKQTSSMGRNTSTVLARKQVRAAGRNPDVAGILLHIESPGGTAAGTAELAADVAAVAQEKPVYAFCEDLCCSAAYWIASQATKVFANATAIVGSIGTYGVVYDLSAMAAKDGVKVHVIRAGAMKGAGTPGTEVTAEQLAEHQQIVNSLNEHFIRGVKAGRGFTLEYARELADGRVYVGQAALERKLIDGVQSLDATFSQLAGKAKRRSDRMHVHTAAEQSAITPESSAGAAAGGAGTSQQTQQAAAQPPAAAPTAPRPATLAELKEACAGAPSDFLLAQLEASATIAQASKAWMSEQSKRLEQLQKENKELAEKQTAQPPKKPGAPPVSAAAGTGKPSSSAANGEDAISQWDEQLQQLMSDRKLSKPQAVRELAIAEPQLHAAYIAAYTAANAHKVNAARARQSA